MRRGVARATGETDPHWASVVLLAHFNGTNGSTTFTDSSSYAWALGFNGQAQISTAQSKFGGASLLLDGTGDYVDAGNQSVFNIQDKDFTLECWAYRSASGGYDYLMVKRPSAVNVGWGFRINNTNTLQFYHANGTSVTSVATVPATQWVHLAATRSGNTVRLFIDGTKVAENASFTNGSTTTDPFRIGVDNGPSDGFTGYIDEVRVTHVARYTADFTPPTAAFPDA
jgi:hypothetical protein